MNDIKTFEQAAAQLRKGLTRLETNQILRQIVESRDGVLGRFQPVFSTAHIPQLSKEEFHAFLLFENNRHWSGLQRHGPKMCADMPLLRRALTVLLNEQQPIESRLDRAVSMVHGMGKAVATAILLIAYPEKYGVWNNTSEGGLKVLNLWPRFGRGESLGSRYAKINQMLNQLSDDLQVDLWTLDTLWWDAENIFAEGDAEEPRLEGTTVTVSGDTKGFPLERHLQDFLWDNWNDTPLGKEWRLYSEPGDTEAGYEYPCGIGRIDLLARHKTRSDWLVIELKRDQTSDTTVGQLLRYIGWIKTHLAEPGEEVFGLVIAHRVDEGLRYALSALPNIDALLYEVKFQLNPVPQPGEKLA